MTLHCETLLEREPGRKTNGAPVTGSRLLVRHAANPILPPDRFPGATCIFNSGVAECHGRLAMLVNLWDREWTPRFLAAWSDDGVHFDIVDRDLATPPQEYPYQSKEGIFDTRITPLEGRFYITYNVASHLGGRIMLARTDDFSELETLGFITGPDHRNCVIFPEKIGGKYVRLERPHGTSDGDIYLSSSPDLLHWGGTKLVLEKNHRYWESAKVGPGAPPVKTSAGWLVLYHGARKGMNGYSYQAGAMLLDLRDPSRIVGKINECLLAPEAPYERVGIVPNVVFPTAAVRHGAPDELKIYYGAADTSMCLATSTVSGLVNACLEAGPPSGCD